MIESLSSGSPISIGLGVALKATALLLAAFAAQAAMGRRAALRSSAWNACLVGLLLPVAGAALPGLKIACLPAPDRAAEVPIQGPGDVDRSGPSSPPPEITREPDPWPSLRPSAVAMPVDESTSPPPSRPVRGRSGDRSTFSRAVRRWGWPVGIPGSIVLAYCGGVIALIARLAGSLAAVRGLRRGVVPVDEPAWGEALGRCRARLGLRRRVTLAASGRVGVPVVVGWFHAAIILPARLAGTTDRAAIDAVLLHELAHVRRRDYAWNILLRLVQALYWTHPLIWAAGRAIRAERERACDDVCIHNLGDRAMDRTTLLDVAEGLARRPGPSTGMAMAAGGPATLASRLAWIDAAPGCPRCRPAAAVRALLVVHGLVAGAGLGTIEPAPRPVTAETPIAGGAGLRADLRGPGDGRSPF